MDCSNIWPFLTLLVTNILNLLTNLAIWFIQQRKNDKFKIELDKEKHLVDMQERLSKLLVDHNQLYYEYTALVQQGDTAGSFPLQEKRRQIEVKKQEIESVRQIISRLTGKELEHIKGGLPPLPPSNLRVR